MTPTEINAFQIVTAPHPALTTRAELVEAFTPEIGLLAQRMLHLMRRRADGHAGIGLAANQVGVLLRVIVLNLPGNKAQCRATIRTATAGDVVLVNPEVIERSGGENWANERCLSHPGVTVSVQRHSRVRIVGRTPLGALTTFEAAGLLARCLQHEIDHLDGISIVDKQGAVR